MSDVKNVLEARVSSDSETDADRASPDSQCRICLGRLQSKSFSDSCLHNFCFQCLVRWSKVKPECPLCKQPFKSIIHNVRSSVDYDQYHVQREEPSMEPTLILSDIMSYRVMVEVFSSEIARGIIRPTRFVSNAANHRRGSNLLPADLAQYSILPRLRPTAVPRLGSSDHRSRRSSLLPPPHHPRPGARSRARTRRDHALAFRASIYREHRWVRPLNEMGGATRECNPQYFRSNPSQIERLRPWLLREFTALLGEDRATSVTNLVALELTRFQIISSEFRAMLQPLLGDRVDQFIHELRAFAQSYYDMAGFDENAEYWANRSPLLSLRHPNASYRGNDSDVEVVDILVRPTEVPAPTPIVISDTDSDVELLIPPIQADPIEVTLLSSDEDSATAPSQPNPSSGRASVITIMEATSQAQSSTTSQDAMPPRRSIVSITHLRHPCYASTSTNASERESDHNSSNSSISPRQRKRTKRKRRPHYTSSDRDSSCDDNRSASSSQHRHKKKKKKSRDHSKNESSEKRSRRDHKKSHRSRKEDKKKRKRKRSVEDDSDGRPKRKLVSPKLEPIPSGSGVSHGPGHDSEASTSKKFNPEVSNGEISFPPKYRDKMKRKLAHEAFKAERQSVVQNGSASSSCSNGANVSVDSSTSSSDDDETLATVAKRVQLGNRLRSCVLLPPKIEATSVLSPKMEAMSDSWCDDSD